MANSIEYFSKFTTKLDDVYKQASKTGMLDISNDIVQAGDTAKQVKIPKISMSGLADYSRETGYIQGDVSLTYETVSCDYDRGRSFNVDAVDNIETAGVAFGTLSSEFVRTQVTPELDAYRFAKYAGTSGILSKEMGSAITSGDSVISEIIAGMSAMSDAEVPEEGRYLFITPTLNNLAVNVDTTKSKDILNKFTEVVVVPQHRFYTAIDLLNGSSGGETAGGYKKAAGGKNINFMIIQKNAVIQYIKHAVTKVITPQINQMSDSWKFFYRAYSLASVYENKVKGIYLNAANA